MSRSESESGTPLYRYRFGAVEFDESRLELSVAGLSVDIEHKPLQVLLVLLRRCGQLVTREDLLGTVWADRVTVEQVLKNAVAKLRKALGEVDAERIVTVPRGGYRFDGALERIAAGKRFADTLRLKAGDTVPERDNFVLQVQLSASRGAEVWLARHRKTDEARVYKVARDPEHLSTLKREATLYRFLRQALGEREDLLRILDWNFESAPFYLECEYGGQNLRDWATQNDQLRALPRATRIAVFLKIADAVEAAHRVGVLHKDLKPANVLIAGAADDLRVRVADFGSGRLLEPERLEQLGITQLGLTLTQASATDPGGGTPLYLAPELMAGGPPTVQSDLYALGLMLYQIISGDLRKPLASGWEQDVGDELLVEDIAEATRGDPGRRLSDVAQLSQRLRSLDARRKEREAGRQARERSAQAERALERARARRPWALAALGMLVIGLATSLLLYRSEREARVQAERAVAWADELNRFLSDDLLGAADPSGPGGAHNPSMREVLARAADTLDTRFVDEPATKASIELALGNAYFGLTDYAQAEKYRREAVRLMTAAYGADSSETLIAQYQLISILVQTNRLDEAAQMLAAADRQAGVRLGQTDRLAFQAHWTRAGYDKLRMDSTAALNEYAIADRIRAAVYPGSDTMLLRLHDALSWCYVRLNRFDDAERVLRDLMTPLYTPQRVGPLFWAQARIDYGVALKSLGKDQDAERVMSDALREVRTSLGPDHFFVGYAQNELADLYARQERWPEAVQSLGEAYRIFRARTGEHGQSTLLIGGNLGIVQYRTGHFQAAVDTLTPIYADLLGQLGASSPQAQIIAYYLASALESRGRRDEAARLIVDLQPSDLANAEPRDDWPSKLQSLRASLQQRLRTAR
jgi:eukaryotic-like serine/threonine-protein kinase